ncbi:hypothetical protein KJB30_14950 [Geobacter chapellei]|uniref:histidine kinase n=2 Tax=Pelotalea chapellei TaxID=44671 RepID=A0ABS5UBP5_9BACT|nr:hypothetical protein [Pelotalea chapellei]
MGKCQSTFSHNGRYACSCFAPRLVDYPFFFKAIFYKAIGTTGDCCQICRARRFFRQVRTGKERRILEKQLIHTQKLESLGILAGGIAHDFNNILTVIIGNADLALNCLNENSPAVTNVNNISKAASRAADLAMQMLAYAGKGKFVIEIISLNLLLQEILHMLQVSISKKAKLKLNLASNLPPVNVDATQMRQIIMNLVINASEAISNEGGIITITTGCTNYDESYGDDIWMDEKIAAGQYVYMEVADNGCGMDNDTLTKIFDPFFTTKFTGRGLGMASVLGIVRSHKGAIKINSETGKGSTFRILLPASENNYHSKDWPLSCAVPLVDDEAAIGVGTKVRS